MTNVIVEYCVCLFVRLDLRGISQIVGNRRVQCSECREPHTFFCLFCHLLQAMSSSPRLSDKELAKINAAAVTREYRVQPHLGEALLCSVLQSLNAIRFRLSHSFCH